MGATRGRLLGQLVVESAIVAIAATATALLLAFWFDELVRRVLFPTLVERVGVNPVVMSAAAIGGACTFVVGLVSSALQLPAQVNSEDLVGRRGAWRRSGIQRELLIAQATLAVLLITGSGMFAQSYIRMASERHESQLNDVLIVTFEDGPAPVRDQNQLLTAALDRLRTMTGVDAATVFAVLPFGTGIHRAAITVPGVDDPRLDGRLPSLIEATPPLFDILRIEIVEGRGLTEEDDRSAPVVVVSETMARAIWHNTNAIGKCIRIDWPFAPAVNAPAPCREVVGIARDWRRELRPGVPRDMHYYVPFARAVSTPRGMAPWPMAEGILIRQRSNADLSIRASCCASNDQAGLKSRRYFAASRRFTHSSEISTAGLHHANAACSMPNTKCSPFSFEISSTIGPSFSLNSASNFVCIASISTCASC